MTAHRYYAFHKKRKSNRSFETDFIAVCASERYLFAAKYSGMLHLAHQRLLPSVSQPVGRPGISRDVPMRWPAAEHCKNFRANIGVQAAENSTQKQI